MRDQEIAKLEAKLKSEPLRSVPDIIDSKGINYERAKDVAGRIEQGELEIKRLDPAGEQGRIKGGTRAIEATVILARNERASEEAGSRTHPVKRQEKLLEEYAKREGIWIDPKEFNTERQGFISKGVEAYVHRDPDGESVTKLIDYKMIDRHATPLDFIDNRIALFNHLFPGTPYELVGFTRMGDDFRFIVKQPLIRDAFYSTPAERQAYMQGKGLTMTDKYGQAFANEIYHVSDLHEKNALKMPDGTIVAIDAVPKAKEVRDFEVVEVNEPLRATADVFYDDNGEPNYEHIADTAEKVLSGRHTIQRLAPEGERGRIKSGRVGIESSILVGAAKSTDTSSRDQKAADERALEKYAKQKGVWFDHSAFVAKNPYLTRGTEALIYHDADDPNSVLKLTPITVSGMESDALHFFDDKVALHNALPNTAPYEVVGYTRNGEGVFQVVLRQPFIKGEEITEPSDDVAQMMQKDAGLFQKPNGGYANSTLEVLDIDKHNVIKTDDGRYIIIDPIISYVKNEDYQPFEVVEKGEALRSTPDESSPFYSRVESLITDKMPPKATPQQVTALLLKNGTKELDPEFIALKVWLDDQGGSVTKADVAEFVAANKVQVEEVVKGDDKVNIEKAKAIALSHGHPSCFVVRLLRHRLAPFPLRRS